MLESLTGSKGRARLLAVLFASPEPLHLRELSRRAKVIPSNASAELSKLAKAGIVKRTQKANLVLFEPNEEAPFYAELSSLLAKTTGITALVRKALNGVTGVEVGFVFGSFAKGEAVAKSDVDVLLVGAPNLIELSRAVTRIEKQTGREINYVVYSPKEFAEKARTNAFLRRVLLEKKEFVKGNEFELKRLAEARPR